MAVLLLCMMTCGYLQGQTQKTEQKPQTQPGRNIQPRIMVIPYTKEGEDIRTVLENDVNKRVVLTKIKEAFDNRGFTTVDFTSRLKAANTNAVFGGENKTDVKAQIIQMSGADIYVEAEIYVSSSLNAGSKVRIILTANEVSSGNALSSKVGESHLFSNDIAVLGMRAVESCMEDFLNVMNDKFSEIVTEGKTIVVVIGFDQGSEYDMSSEVGTQGMVLSDEIEIWMSENAYKNYYHLQGTTDTEMYFDDVRIPLRDPSNGNNYTVNRFAFSFFQFLRSLGLNVKRDVIGNTLRVTIQ
jgi:hypothetical protein